MVVNYQDGKIYKIICNVTNLVYIGSTCQRLSQRLACHVSDYKSWKSGKKNYITSYKILEGGNYDIVLIKQVKCNNKEELYAEERKAIESMKCVNRIHPTRTYKQYRVANQDKIKQLYEDNKAELLKQMKQYNEANKDKIKEQQSQKFTCECGGKYLHGNKSIHFKTIKHQKFINKTE